MSGHKKTKKAVNSNISAKSPAIKKKQGVAKAKQECVVWSKFEDEGAKITGRNDSGLVFHTLRLRQKRDYAKDRNAQVLRHLSNVLYDKVKDGNKEEQEIQVMEMNGRLIVSANDPKSIELLANDTGANDATLADYVAFSSLDQDRRTTQMSRKLSGRMRAVKEMMGEREAFKTLKGGSSQKVKDVFFHVKVSRWAGDQSVLLTDDKLKGKIILLEAPKAHAEQKIVRMLIAAVSGQTDIVKLNGTIWGKKRPCQGCLKALQICKDAGFNIKFDPYPGLLWKGSCDSIDAVCEFLQGRNFTFPSGDSVADYLKKLAAKEDSYVTQSKYDGEEDQGAGTDSESELEDPALTAANARKKSDAAAEQANKAITALRVAKAAAEAFLAQPPPQPSSQPTSSPAKTPSRIAEECGELLDQANRDASVIDANLNTAKSQYVEARSSVSIAETDVSRWTQFLERSALGDQAAAQVKLDAAAIVLKEVQAATAAIAKTGESIEKILAEAVELGKRIDVINAEMKKRAGS